MVKFSLAGDQWLGPGTVRVAFQLHDTMVLISWFSLYHGILLFSFVELGFFVVARWSKILMTLIVCL